MRFFSNFRKFDVDGSSYFVTEASTADCEVVIIANAGFLLIEAIKLLLLRAK